MGIEHRVIQAAIAGLLHDVGKIAQRARPDPWNPPEGITKEGQPVHAAWTQYLVQHAPKAYPAAVLAGAYHHRPNQSPGQDHTLSELVALADKLSAGERADDPPGEKKRQDLHLVSIFDRLALAGERRKGDWHYLPLRSLCLEKGVLFPTGLLTLNQQKDAYEALCKELEQAIRLEIADPQTYLENLLGALQSVAWCVPSAYYHSVPDVSLYDHSRMTAALAACLAGWKAEEIRSLLGAVQRNFENQPQTGDQALLDQPVAVLVGGDISGIQDFIYTISSKGAARTLRGRSYYLQLLTEAVLRFTLEWIGLPYTNVIYSGGGHFFLLAPVSAQERLYDLRRVISEKLLRYHGDELYLALAGVPVPASGFKLGEFPAYWEQMHQAVAAVKQQRYIELGDGFYERLFAIPAQGGNPDASCSVCGNDHLPARAFSEDEEQARICTLCDSFGEEIGRILPQARFLALGLGSPVESEQVTAKTVLAAFGLHAAFLRDEKEAPGLPEVERLAIWALEDPKDGKWPEVKGLPAARFLRYTVNQVPPLSFDKLEKRCEAGFKRLGVLRLDVDNLGLLFQRGLGKELASLSRLSTLSLQLSLYFEGWIKRICEEYGDLIYAVYAGGDDVFLIGPWDRMPELALKIRQEFADYVSNHTDLHLSGGMAFIHGKYPVYQAADDAGKAEEQAKAYPGKNAFSFLGRAWSWDDFDAVRKKRDWLLKIVKPEDREGLSGPQSILHILQKMAQDEAEAVRLRGRPVWGPWLWLGPYMLTRMAQRARNVGLRQEVEALRDELDANNYGELAQWGTAARWAQLLVRKTAKD